MIYLRNGYKECNAVLPGMISVDGRDAWASRRGSIITHIPQVSLTPSLTVVLRFVSNNQGHESIYKSRNCLVLV